MQKILFCSDVVRFVFRYFGTAEFIKNNGFALSGLYAELQRPKKPKNVIVKYITEYIRSPIDPNGIYYKPKTGHKNKL